MCVFFCCILITVILIWDDFRSLATVTSAPSEPPHVYSKVNILVTHVGCCVTCTHQTLPVLVCAGKWAYEVLISSQGLMQIGWCTLNCRFNQEVMLTDCCPSYTTTFVVTHWRPEIKYCDYLQNTPICFHSKCLSLFDLSSDTHALLSFYLHEHFHRHDTFANSYPGIRSLLTPQHGRPTTQTGLLMGPKHHCSFYFSLTVLYHIITQFLWFITFKIKLWILKWATNAPLCSTAITTRPD